MFNIGDVVRLNCGGKEMVVAQVNGQTAVQVIWQQANGYGQLSISPTCLYLVRRFSDTHIHDMDDLKHADIQKINLVL